MFYLIFAWIQSALVVCSLDTPSKDSFLTTTNPRTTLSEPGGISGHLDKTARDRFPACLGSLPSRFRLVAMRVPSSWSQRPLTFVPFWRFPVISGIGVILWTWWTWKFSILLLSARGSPPWIGDFGLMMFYDRLLVFWGWGSFKGRSSFLILALPNR